MHAFTLVFLAALALSVAMRLWLASRQLRFVAAHRGAVPGEFAERVSLAAHQKAADYTAAKTRLGMVEVLVSALVLLGFTVGGGLQALFDGWARIFEPAGYAHGVTLIVSVAAISSAIDLP